MLLAPKLENIASLKDDPEDRSHRAHHAHIEWLKHGVYSGDLKGNMRLNKTARVHADVAGPKTGTGLTPGWGIILNTVFPASSWVSLHRGVFMYPGGDGQTTATIRDLPA